MTNWMWIPYVIDVVNGFNVLLIFAVLITALVVVWSLMYKFIEGEPSGCTKPFSIACVIFAIMVVFIPSKQTMYQMAGLGAVQTIVQSKTATKAVELAEAYLDKQLKSVKEDKK